MYVKLIVAAVAVLFFFVQLGATLQCYHCETPQECKSPSKITCNRTNANKTYHHLKTYYLDVPNAPSDNFNCFMHNYTKNNAPNMTYLSCVFRTQPDACHLSLNASYANLVRQNCTECSGNLCNYRNPAASVSASIYTLFVSIMGVFMAKALVH